ncbi:NADP-dependent oxidoreductase [Dictyobacter aurantiacus]|uniref:Enoyl reductase (ER) domain-containing protein n=1 Tax=Dictyobacter aurantiacus TaxID=1936993 RepID=A0A401ZKC6_9CHLR|nr:NADP-dependent oxidoreductase [Dictyobacter aurantiacus]GCE07305.1 hypothetical protein KDAU_46340 [Dictyobacter aurantiacus]
MIRASQLARANTLIRFIGYQPRPGMPAGQFITAWQATVAAGEQPKGLIYRELCQQADEWNELVHEEAQNPNPYEFIDYAILQPDQDPSLLPTLPVDIAARYEVVEGLFTIAHPFVKPELTGSPETLLYNCFEISGGPAIEQGFVLGWPARGDYQAQQEGFYSAFLHRRVQPDVRIAAFNRAEWQSATRYADTLAGFEQHFPRQARAAAGTSSGRPPVHSYLGLYRIAHAFQGPPTPLPATMKAVVMHGYGGPQVLRYQDTPRPVAGPGQVLLRVHAAEINPLDLKMRSGAVKTIHPAWPEDILGFGMAGTIEAVGRGVDEKLIGQAVYGTDSPFVRGCYAEYVAAPASFFQPKPMGLTFVQAASIPVGVGTAHNALFTMAGLQPGQRVLIHGGSGTVGGFAVQLAKRAGAYVIVTASAARLDYARDLGADEVIDYQAQRFEEHLADLDVVLDTIGGETRERSWQVLRRGGTLVTLVPPLPDPALAARYGVRAVMNQNSSNESQFLRQVTALLEQSQLRVPEIGRVVPLSQASQAHELLEQSQVRGRIILEIA